MSSSASTTRGSNTTEQCTQDVGIMCAPLTVPMRFTQFKARTAWPKEERPAEHQPGRLSPGLTCHLDTTYASFKPNSTSSAHLCLHLSHFLLATSLFLQVTQPNFSQSSLISASVFAQPNLNGPRRNCQSTELVPDNMSTVGPENITLFFKNESTLVRSSLCPQKF